MLSASHASLLHLQLHILLHQLKTSPNDPLETVNLKKSLRALGLMYLSL